MTTAMEELVVTVTPRNRANFRRLKTNSIQSVKRWEKENELLYAMMEDESEWLAKLFPDVVISPEFFFYALEDGSLLCRLANYIQEKAELYSQKHNVPVPGKKFRFHTMSKCGREIKLFRSRENVQQFLIWCRSHGLPEAILFESNDVVQVDDYREGCRGVIICLMEIVRRTAKFDLDELPQLIQMEKEIEEDEAHSDTELSNEQGQVLDVEKINMTEIDNLEVHADQPEIQSPSSLDSDSGVDSVFDQDEGDNTASRLTEFSHEETEKTEKTTTCTVTVRKQTSSPKPKDHKSSPKKGKELPSLLESTGPKSELDKQVCKIAQDYNIKVVHRLKEGKYIILGRVMFVRMLNDHMLVRIGGGWDTLEHYLMTHAPSKEALEAPSTPSSQAITSPRNSISAASGVRTSLFERVKRKEQVGIVIRESAVYSSQGSLNQQLGAASSPRIKGKRESLKDEKDITDAIRKISTSVSQNLAERPVSFTNKTFHQLKSRFDKGIFGAARRTSSPDLTLKGDKIRRRLSDTPRMADVATTLAFDGEQVPVANNNDTESKQPENAEEQDVGKVVAPTGDLLGDASLQRDISTPENIFSDETDSGVPVGDLLSMETSNQPHLNGDSLDGQVNGVANVVDVSSFDPFAAAPRQSELVSTGNEALDEQEEQPMSMTVVDNGALAHVEQSPEAVSETTPESSPRVDLGDLLRDAEPDSTLDASPRPVDLGDLLLDSETTTEQEEIELAPAVTLEEDVPTVQTVPASQTTEVEDARRDEPVADEDVSSNTQEVRSVVVEPTPETLVESESESLKVGEQSGEVGHVRGDEPVMDEDVLVSVSDVPPFVVDSMQEKLIETEVEPPKPEEESIELEQGGPDEPVMIVDIPTSIQDNPPPPLSDPTPETLVETTEVETPKPEEESTPGEKTVEELPSVEEEPTSCEESVLEMELELPKVDGGFSNIEETTHSEEPVVEKASELHEIEGKPVNVEEPAKEEEPANVEEPFSGEEALIKSEGVSTEAGPEVGSPEVDATTTQEGRGALASDDQVAEREPLKADDDKPVETAKVEKASDKGTQSKPAVASSRPKSPPKAAPVTKQTPAKKPTGATRPTSPTKAPTSAPAKKDAKASVPRAPASKPAASKAPASAVASAKKPAAKPGTTKAEEQKKPEKTKSAAATRPSSKTSESKMQGAARPTSSSTTGKKPLSSTTAPSAAKVPSKGVKDAGPTKSTPKTTTTKPPSAKPAATKTASSATKPAAAKPTRTQSAKPVDSTDSAALAKKPMARPQSAKPKVTTSTTTVKKTTTTTTKVGAGPVKSQTTTTKTVTQSKSGQPKSSTTTTTTTKTTAKPGTRPASAAVKKAGTTGAKSKTGGQPGTGATGGKSATKCAPKKKAEEPAKEKGMKQEGKTPEPTTTVDKKPTEVVETSTEVVEAVVEPPGEASREDKSNELTPDSAPVDQTTPEVEEASEEIVEQFSVVTHVVTAETTTVIKDGEEQSTTTTEETTFEQSAES